MKLTAHQVADIAAMAAAAREARPEGYNIHHAAFLLCQVHICGRKLRKVNERGCLDSFEEAVEVNRLKDKATRILKKLGANVIRFSLDPLSKPIQFEFDGYAIKDLNAHTFRYQLG